MRPTNRLSDVEEQKPPGIIDTLGNAFALLNQRPYLILLPVLLDLFLWLGIGVSVQSLTDTLARWLRDIPTADPDMIRQMTDAGKQFDLLSLLGISTPTLVDSIGRGTLAALRDRDWVTGLPWWSIPPLALVIGVAGICFGMLYLTTVGFLVRGQSLIGTSFLRQAGRNAVRMLGFIVVAILGIVLLFIPAFVFGGILLVVGVNVVPFLALLGWMGLMWVFFLLFFAQYAIVVANAGVFRAIYLSYNVVRRNIWAAAGFVIAYLLLTNGVPVALRVFTHTPWGVPLAIIGNAYVATGVVAAAMLFFRDRARVLPSVPPVSAEQPS